MKKKEILFVFILTILINANLKGQIQVFNLADDFLRYYISSKDLSNELKIENFNTNVYNKAPFVYENIFNDIKWIGQNTDERVLNYVDKFETIEKKYIELNNTLVTQFDSALLTFQKEFPDFEPNFDVYFLHSLGIRAGGLVTIKDNEVLMFGIDQITSSFDFQNFIPFFHHELTHFYHSLYYTPVEDGKYSKGAIYNYLWREGLAGYVSSVLNPDARQKEVFMRDSLSQKTDKVLKIIAQDILENLYSSDTEVIRKYFWGSSTDTVIPKTAGYYIGFILVKELANEYTLNELIKLTEDIFVPKFLIIFGNIRDS